MACNPARFARLPIPEQQKQLLAAFSADPANDAISTQLCQASDEEVIQVAAKLAPPQGQAQGEPAEQQRGLGSLMPGAQAGRPPQAQAPQPTRVPRPMDPAPVQAQPQARRPAGRPNGGLAGLLGRGR